MYHQTGGENDANHLYLGGNNAERSAGTYLLDAGDLVSQTQTVGDLNTSAPGLFHQSGGANATAILEIDPTGRYELTAGQLSSREVLLSGGFYQTGGDNAPGYLSIHDTGQYHWSGGTLRITRGLSVYGAFEFPATAAAPVTLYADGLVTLANPAALTNTHNVELVLGPNSLLSHPAGFDPAAAFGSYTNAGLDHVLGTPLVIPAGTSIVSGGAIDDPLDLAGSLVGLDDFSDDLVLYNHFTLRPGGVLGERRGLNFTIRPGAGTSRVLGGTLNAGGIYTGFPLSNVTATATFQQSAGSVTLDALSFDAASFYDLSGGTLTVLDGASLAGTYAAEPRAEFHQTGGSFTARSLFIAGGRQRGALFTIAAGSLTVQAATVGDHYNGNTANYPHTVQFDIAGSNADIRIGALTFQPDSEFTAVPGSTIHLASLSIASTDPDSFPGLAHLRLLFDTGPTQPGQLEVAGADLGPTLAGLVGNFALDTLEVGPADGAGGWLTLIDSVDNQPTFLAHDALYVRELVLNSNATLDLNGLHLYYDHLTNNGGTVLLHGGLLLQLPEPTSLAGLFPCVAALARCRRRRTFRPA